MILSGAITRPEITINYFKISYILFFIHYKVQNSKSERAIGEFHDVAKRTSHIEPLTFRLKACCATCLR